MNSVKSLKCFIFLMCLLLPVHARAIVMEGVGETHDHALSNALRQAVESVLGTALNSQIIVEHGLLVKDEIIAHAKGYVSSYKIIDKGPFEGSAYFVKVDAQVNEGLVLDHIESLEILMKMARNPKVWVFGLDDDMASVSASSGQFQNLTQSLEKVFRERFRFRILDRKVAEGKAGRAYTPKPSKDEAVKMAKAAEADIALFVKVNVHSKHASEKNGKLILEAIRVSDGFSLGQNTEDLSIVDWEGGHSGMDVAALDEARERLFNTGVRLARLVVEDLQRQAESGTNYVIIFRRFPREQLGSVVSEGLPLFAGYVRHKVELMAEREARVRYWSHLSIFDIDERIAKVLREKEMKFTRRTEGQLLEYQWKHPMFD